MAEEHRLSREEREQIIAEIHALRAERAIERERTLRAIENFRRWANEVDARSRRRPLFGIGFRPVGRP